MSPGNDPGIEGRLAACRGKIDDLDARLLALLVERARVVEEVAALKMKYGFPVHHPAREADLLTERRREAMDLGLDPDMVEGIFRTILRGSRIAQTESMSGLALRPGARVVVVGGRGAMGSLLCDWFGQAGYETRVLERNDWDQADDICRGAQLAVLAVPIDSTPQIAARLGAHLPASCVLADLTSVKKKPLRAMLEAHRGPVVGLHPMFGPGIRSLDRQVVVLVPGRGEEEAAWVGEQLAAWGAVIVRSTAEEHDEVMDLVQGLRHFATFCFGQFLADTCVDLQRTLEFASPIYRLELGMVGRLFAQDPHLYAGIIFSTPERRAQLVKFLERLQDNREMLASGDTGSFLREFARVAAWFGPFGDQAIRESNFMIDKMIERS